MTIIYACIFDNRKRVLVDSIYKGMKGNFKSLALDNYESYRMVAIDMINLDEKFTLYYRHFRTWILVAICDPETTRVEITNFFDHMEGPFKEPMQSSEI